jgi:hypothetical protein
MTYFFLGSGYRKLAVIVVMAAAVAAGACSTNTGSSATPFSDRAVRKAPMLSWAHWIKVAPVSNAATEVTGINNLTGAASEIVGFYTLNPKSSSKAMSYSFTINLNGTTYTTVTPASYPLVHNGTQPVSSLGTQMNSIAPESSGSSILGGWVSDPGNECGIWPVVDNQGLWTLDYNGGGNNTTTELFGINDSGVAVGYTANTATCQGQQTNKTAVYTTAAGAPTPVPFAFTENPSGSVAYGINDDGDMVGHGSFGSVSKGWYALCAHANKTGTPNCPTFNTNNGSQYCWKTLEDPSGTDTVAYAISGLYEITAGNITKLVVGSYLNNTDGLRHGFVVPVTLTESTKGSSADSCEAGLYQDVKEPNGAKGTVVLGVNDAGDIVGSGGLG